MKQTVHLHTFRNAFEQCRPDNFSYEGLGILFDYLEQYEDDTGVELELDVIGICCDWSEDSFEGVVASYSLDEEIDDWADLDDDEQKEAVTDWLNDHTMVAGTTDDSIIYCTSF